MSVSAAVIRTRSNVVHTDSSNVVELVAVLLNGVRDVFGRMTEVFYRRQLLDFLFRTSSCVFIRSAETPCSHSSCYYDRFYFNRSRTAAAFKQGWDLYSVRYSLKK